MDVREMDRIRESLRAHHRTWTEDEVDTVADRVLATLNGLAVALGIPEGSVWSGSEEARRQVTIKEPDHVSSPLHPHPGRSVFPSPVGRAGPQRQPSWSSLDQAQASNQFAPAYRDEVV